MLIRTPLCVTRVIKICQVPLDGRWNDLKPMQIENIYDLLFEWKMHKKKKDIEIITTSGLKGQRCICPSFNKAAERKETNRRER